MIDFDFFRCVKVSRIEAIEDWIEYHIWTIMFLSSIVSNIGVWTLVCLMVGD